MTTQEQFDQLMSEIQEIKSLIKEQHDPIIISSERLRRAVESELKKQSIRDDDSNS